MALFVQALNYGLITAFGVALSAEFVGAIQQRCAFAKLTAFTAVSLIAGAVLSCFRARGDH